MPGRQVLLWPDTWNNYYHPQTLLAAETVLQQAGFDVIVPGGHICCGRPLYDFGHLRAARAYLADVLDRMAPHIEAGLPFIFLEPSWPASSKTNSPSCSPTTCAQNSCARDWLLADWLQRRPGLRDRRLRVRTFSFTGTVITGGIRRAEERDRLLRQAGATVEPIEAGCCGMAGPFGFEAGKFEVSRTIAGQGLLPAVEAAGPMTIIVADGFSCREQIMQLGFRRALHFAEVLAHGCGCGG